MTEFTKDDIEYYRKQYALWTSRSQTTPEELHLIGRLQDALDEIERQAKRIAELEAERRWIPVSDKENLPDVGVEILGWEVRRNRYVLDWLKYRDGLSNTEPTFLFSFDYWQPLPNPPKDGE